MKKLMISIIWLLCSVSAFCQKGSHFVAIEAGCSLVDEAIGPQLGARYHMGATKHLDLTASLSSSCGFNFDESAQKKHYSSNCYSMSVGFGGHADFLKVCRLRLLAEGGMVMLSNDNVLYLRPSLGGIAEIVFQLNPSMEVGMCCGKSWMAYEGSMLDAVSKVCILWNVRLK